MSLARAVPDGVVRSQPLRKLTPTQELEVARLLDARPMVHRPSIARLYGISKRQVYRIRDRVARPRVEAEVGGFKAWFEIDELGPVQVTAWRAA